LGRAVPQLETLDLAGSRLGQLLDEDHRPGILVPGGVGWMPSLSTTKATGFSRPSSLAAPQTPLSSTVGCSCNTASTSAGQTDWPLTFNMSLARPEYQK